MRTDSPPLALHDVFAEIPDPRPQRGQLYPLAAVLTMVATAMLCGARSLAAIAAWGLHSNHLAPSLGLGRKTRAGTRYRTPCSSELHTVLKALSAELFEAAWTRWSLAHEVSGLDQRLVAIDGTTRRGSPGHQLPAVRWLAAFCPDVAAVIAELAVPGQTNKHPTAWQRLQLIALERRIRGQGTDETVSALTSLGPEDALARRLLTLAREHWGIENRLPWVRDVSLGEDAGRVRTGAAAQILAGRRHTGRWWLRSRGLTAIASTLWRHAAKPEEALNLVMRYVPT